jgi:hypothetical protein
VEHCYKHELSERADASSSHIFFEQMTMKKTLLLLLLILGCALRAQAQSTTVSGTVTDAGSQAWAGGAYSFTFVPNPQFPVGPYTWTGGTLTNVISGTLDGSGHYSQSVPSNTAITPAGSKWILQVTPNATWPSTSTPGTPIAGGTQTLNVTPAAIAINLSSSPVGSFTRAYTDGEITTAPLGGQYYNVTFGAVRVCNVVSGQACTSWSGAGGGSSGGGGTSPVQSGMLAFYRALPTESVGALVDYSGNNNNATGTVGTGTAITPSTGGVTCNGNGAVTLPATLNGALTVQILLASNNPFVGGQSSPVLSSGSGTSGGVGLITVAGGSPGIPPYGPSINGATRIETQGGNSGLAYAQARAVSGLGVVNVAMVMDTLDHVYVNGIEDSPSGLAYYNQQRSSAGLNGTPFQLCGSATGQSSSLYFVGGIISALFYNRVLLPAEVWQNAIAQCQDAIGRGYSIVCPNNGTNPANQALTSQFVADGDSLTSGSATTPYTSFIALNNTFNIANQGIGGSGITQQLPSAAPRAVDPMYSINTANNVVTIWAGVNDNCTPSVQAVFNGLVSYVTARKAVGWQKVLPITMLDHSGASACKNSYDALIRTFNWPDGFIDAAADPNIGADGSAAGGGNTWWQAGGLHPSQYAVNNSETPIIQARINEEYGNTILSTATTYASAAAAAVATTAGSESGSTVTITMGTTPANCVLGSDAVVSGVTPSGYNSANTEGWTLTAVSGTTISFVNVSGLGPITVQGTVSCPQQQEKDVVEILNFGAGNHTLQPCAKFIGLHANNGRVTIENINAAGSTLVPFLSETITGGGATPTTLAAHTTAILQPALVSSAASGCNWVRLQ